MPAAVLREPARLQHCNASAPCTVPCSAPGSVPWFPHADRIEGTSTGFTYDAAAFSPRAARWRRPERTGAVRMMEHATWGSNAFRLRAVNATSRALHLGPGGWQNADAGLVQGNRFYVEGVVEEADSPGEWALDPDERVLYVFPNASRAAGRGRASAGAAHAAAPPPPARVEASVLDTVVAISARHVELTGLRITGAAPTQLTKRYEVPSGGDWAIGRVGAVFVEDAEGIHLTDNVFDAVGGNAVVLSRHAAGCQVTGNRIAFPGDSGVALIGVSEMADGTRDTFPRDNVVARNWVHDIGTFGKQV